MKFDYYYAEQTEQFQFVMIPRALISGREFEELSFAARLIYGLLRDKVSLSRKNGWIDDYGHVYIIYTNKQLMEEMSLSEKLVIKYTNELEAFGLIEKKRQGLGLPNLVYVKNFIATEETHKNGDEEAGKLRNSRTSQTGSSRTSQTGSSDLPEWEALDLPEAAANNINNTYTEKNHTQILSSREPVKEPPADDGTEVYEFYESHVKMQIDYDSLLEEPACDKGMLDNIVSIMTDVLSMPPETMMIGRQERSGTLVKKIFLRLEKKHIEYVIDKLRTAGSNICNIRQYVLTMLYYAEQTYDCYIMAEVSKGFAAGF